MNDALTTYKDACRYLDDLQMHKIKLGLAAMREVLTGLGSPERHCPAVHVAGTNGKGSVCSLLRAMLTEAGYRTGLYTSPHLSSVRERFRIDERYISEADFTRLMERIRVALAGRTITYFECVTALAFCWFAEQDCDLIILETGMGGRLDATNVIVPLVSVITTISLDHEQYLGESVAAVAFEKAGIIKPGVPVVSGVADQEAVPVIERVCRERGASLLTRGSDFFLEADGTTHSLWRDAAGEVRITGIPPRGAAWQLDNCACAVAAAITLRRCGYTIPDEAIRSGIGAAIWPGRMEYLEVSKNQHSGQIPLNRSDTHVRFLLDGAHNPAGVAHLVEAVRGRCDYRRLLLVWASMADKKYETMLRAMAGEADLIVLTRPASERSARPEEMARVLAGNTAAAIRCCQTVPEALAEVVEEAAADDLVVVAGSLYLIGEFRRLLVGEVVA